MENYSLNEMTVRPGRVFSDNWKTKDNHFHIIGTRKITTKIIVWATKYNLEFTLS